MGSVYRAENCLLGKPVALKWMRPELTRTPVAAERFLREARAASRIHHPNVVDVYDVVQEGENLILVMELLQGETLRDYFQREPRSPGCIALLLHAMRGIACAHECGVLHRDLKPGNIMIIPDPASSTPIVKVVDFGIAKLLGDDGRGPTLTQTGATLGTPAYMSLEQLRGDATLDARSDIYSLGVMLFEGLTGRMPYDASTLSELIIKVATTDALPTLQVAPSLPPTLAQIVDRALARDREQRWPDVPSLMHALAPFAAAKAQESAPHDTALTRPEVPDTLRPRERPARRPSLTLGWPQLSPRSRALLGGALLWIGVVFGPRLVSRSLQGVTGNLAGLIRNDAFIRTPVCLIDANADSIPDVVGIAALADKGPLVVLDGRDGTSLFSEGSYAFDATLLCPDRQTIVVHDTSTLEVTLRNSADLQAVHRRRLHDKPMLWGMGQGCLTIQTKDDQVQSFDWRTGQAVDCPLSKPLEGAYALQAMNVVIARGESWSARRDDTVYTVSARTPGTPVLSASARGHRDWSLEVPLQNERPAQTLTDVALVLVGKPIEGDGRELHVVGLSVDDGHLLYDRALCGRNYAVSSLYSLGSRVVLSDPWTGVWVLDAATGRILWHHGTC